MGCFKDQITGVVLAGGQGRRMGGVDKGLVDLAGRTMIEHVIERLAPQVGNLMINANSPLETYAALGYPVVPDADDDFLGPLAGILAAMRSARTAFVLTVPCDTPLLAPDLADRLWHAVDRAGAELAVAHDGDRLQPVFALITTSLADSLARYMARGGRKIDRWYETHRLATVDFSDAASSFVNVNDPQQRANIEAMLVESD